MTEGADFSSGGAVGMGGSSSSPPPSSSRRNAAGLADAKRDAKRLAGVNATGAQENEWFRKADTLIR